MILALGFQTKSAENDILFGNCVCALDILRSRVGLNM